MSFTRSAAGPWLFPVAQPYRLGLGHKSKQRIVLALAKRLVSEVALADVIEKALSLTRTLAAGRQEPNEVAQQQVDQNTTNL